MLTLVHKNELPYGTSVCFLKRKNRVIDYELFVYTMLGSVVKEIELNEKQGVLTIPTQELNSGVYFYSLSIDGELQSGKLIYQ